jgi:DNA-directed RNA polymerase subunit omega
MAQHYRYFPAFALNWELGYTNFLMDFIALPTEFDKKKFDSRYRLVIAVAKRARVLHHGAIPRITSKSRKMTTVALEEVVSDAVRVLSGSAAIKAKEKAKKLNYEDMMDEAKQKQSLPEELSKFEKDLQAYLREKDEVANENNSK